MKKLKSLTIFFPAYNDEKSIPLLVTKAYQIARHVASSFEVIVVNDASTDNTHKILEKLKLTYPDLKVINHRKNSGYGGALISGFLNSSKEWVFYTDGDGQYDPSEITKLHKKVVKHVDAVNGYKLERGDNFLRKFIGNTYNWIIHKLYDLPISDVDCDFRLIKRSFLKKFDFVSTSGVFPLELVLKLRREGARFTEVGVHHYKRPYGKSQFFSVKHLFKTLTEHIVFYRVYNKNRYENP